MLNEHPLHNKLITTMGKLLGLTFWISLALSIAAWWNYDRFLSPMPADSRLGSDPVQKSTQRAPFEVNSNGVSYLIDPLFQYDLYGLVVSRRAHDGDYRLHRLWNDHLNVADLCVVWGKNARLEDLNDYDFRSGQFTCFVETSTLESWNAFDPTQLSNNHVLTEKPHLRSLIESVEVGDQIHLTGLLAEYSNDTGFRRGSSTNRTDEGNGACETIYAESFSIIKTMETTWRWIWQIAGLSSIFSALLWLYGAGSGKF